MASEQREQEAAPFGARAGLTPLERRRYDEARQAGKSHAEAIALATAGTAPASTSSAPAPTTTDAPAPAVDGVNDHRAIDAPPESRR